MHVIRRYDLSRHFSEFAVTFNSSPLLRLLSDILRSSAARLVGKTVEPNLRGIVELVFRNKYCIQDRLLDEPQVYCVQADLSVTRVRIRDNHDTIVTWELRTLSLTGIRRGEVGLYSDAPPSTELSEFHQQLISNGEIASLSRPYRFWSAKTQTFETRLLDWPRQIAQR